MCVTKVYVWVASHWCGIGPYFILFCNQINAETAGVTLWMRHNAQKLPDLGAKLPDRDIERNILLLPGWGVKWKNVTVCYFYFHHLVLTGKHGAYWSLMHHVFRLTYERWDLEAVPAPSLHPITWHRLLALKLNLANVNALPRNT